MCLGTAHFKTTNWLLNNVILLKGCPMEAAPNAALAAVGTADSGNKS